MTRRARLRTLAAGIAPALALVACTAGPGAPPASIPRSPAPSELVTPSRAPGEAPGGVPGETPGERAGSGGAPGITPAPIAPGGPRSSLGPIQAQPPTEVQPVPNLLDVHDVRAESVTAAVHAGQVTATVVWWSGPAPCSELSAVKVMRSGNVFTLTVREGSQELGIACPAIAVHKQATVQLGALPPGSYTLAATGVDTPITVTVPG